MLVLGGGRQAEYGLVGAIGFHVALLSFGWGFYGWAVPMLVALSLLLRAQRAARASGGGLPTPASILFPRPRSRTAA